MNKHKIVAILNLLLGISEILSPFIYLGTALPALNKMYSDFESMGYTANLPSFTFTYFMFGVIVIMGIVNLFLGIKLFSQSKESRERYLKYGTISAIVAFVLFGILFGVATLPVILSIHNLIPQL